MSETHEERIVEAANRLAVAQTELTGALGEMPTTTSPDKRIVTDRLRSALSEIITARRMLSTLLNAPRTLAAIPDR